MSAPVNPSEHFDVHASLVYQLGESLITDSVQALVELVKNSYDADATYCKVSIITSGEPPADTSNRNSKGWIVVEDNGTGMSLSDIRRGWLTISDSHKREMKRKNGTTKRGRTPLGDKGLGRLSTQRLGHRLEMFTRKKGENSHRLDIDWRQFSKFERLSQVPVSLDLDNAFSSVGTKLIISDLLDLSSWRGESLREIERRLSQLISPYKEVQEFQIYASADGTSLDLAEISTQLRKAAQLTYKITFDGELLSVRGKARLSYFRPQKQADRPLFDELMVQDNGDRFVTHLQSLPGWRRLSATRAQAEGWYLNFGFSKSLDHIPEMERLSGVIANPGPFTSEVDSFNLSPSPDHDVFGSTAEVKKVVALLSGIRVYRDGFGIRVDADWLRLAKQWTGGGSWYGLRPQNTVGYVALSARDNSQLEETTDREGFKENSYYLNFYEMLQNFVRFAAESQEFFRRSWSDFRKLFEEHGAGISIGSTPEAIAQDIGAALSRSASYRMTLGSFSARLQSNIAGTKALLERVSHGDTALSPKEIQQTAERLRNSIDDAAASLKEVETYLEELHGTEKKARVVTEQIEALREQITEVYEVIGLGMTAEALTHELNNIATQLSDRTQEIGRYVRSQIRDTRVLTYIQHVKTSIAEFRRQLNFLAPSLKLMREQREEFEIWDFVKDIFGYYTKRFSDSPISIEPKNRSRKPFRVVVNRGKLIEIIDNLLLNSEYWLKEDIKAHRIVRGVITIEAENPYLRISDNGMGIDPVIESSLFEPFVSMKGKGKGRGLGLYIVQQLLSAEGCTITLSQERNSFDRRYKFDLDLSGISHG